MNTKGIFIKIIIVIAIIGGVVWLARPGQQAQTDSATNSTASQTSSLLTTEHTFFDFGQVSMAKGLVTHIFTIKNSTLNPVTLQKMYTSCMCTTASLIKGSERFGPFGMPGHGTIPSINKTLNPGEEATVEAIFDPNAHGPAGVGLIERMIRIEQEGSGPLELSFKVYVVP